MPVLRRSARSHFRPGSRCDHTHFTLHYQSLSPWTVQACGTLRLEMIRLCSRQRSCNIANPGRTQRPLHPQRHPRSSVKIEKGRSVASFFHFSKNAIRPLKLHHFLAIGFVSQKGQNLSFLKFSRAEALWPLASFLRKRNMREPGNPTNGRRARNGFVFSFHENESKTDRWLRFYETSLRPCCQGAFSGNYWRAKGNIVHLVSVS